MESFDRAAAKRGIKLHLKLKNTPLQVLLIAIVGLLAYSNTFTASFHYDDKQNIVENPLIKNWHYFTDPSSARQSGIGDLFYTRYIGYLSFALDYQVHGLDLVGYHVVNLAVHIASALLVYWLALLTFATPFFVGTTQSSCPLDNPSRRPTEKWVVPLFAALLFVSHPVQTQAVTYIVQRFASLATMFYLLSLVAYVRWRLDSLRIPDTAPRTRRLGPVLWYLASVVCAVLAMKTKEIAFTLPLVIALYEFMFFEGAFKKRVFSLAPLLLTMLIIPLTLIGTGKAGGEIIGAMSEAARIGSPMSRWDYLLTQFRVIVTYIRLLFLPYNQNLDYDYPLAQSLLEPEVLLSFVALVALFGLGVYFLSRSRRTSHGLRLVAFGIFWFFITLAVESSIIPIGDVIFEHRIYLPSVGACFAIAMSAFLICEMLRVRWPASGKVGITLGVFVIVALAGAAYARNAIWHDDAVLWEDIVSKSPMKARGRYNLGVIYTARGSLDQAIEQYLAAIRIQPDYAEAHYNLGNVYLSQNRIDETIREFEAAIKFNLRLAFAHYVLGSLYSSQGRLDEAVAQYQSALKLKPDSPYVHNSLAVVYTRLNRIDAAIQEYGLASTKPPRTMTPREGTPYHH